MCQCDRESVAVRLLLYDDLSRQRFIPDDQGDIAARLPQGIAEQAADSAGAQYMPVVPTHGLIAVRGIVNWRQVITMGVLLSCKE